MVTHAGSRHNLALRTPSFNSPSLHFASITRPALISGIVSCQHITNVYFLFILFAQFSICFGLGSGFSFFVFCGPSTTNSQF